MSHALSQTTTPAGLLVAPLRARDRAAWERLARGYHDFYGEVSLADAYDDTWARLTQAGGVVDALGAYHDDRLVGIAHYLFHAHVWHRTVCYLQDLFVDEDVRGRGVGRALIAGVARAAVERGAFRLYWTTKEDNTRARLLYDKVATFRGFVRYDAPLDGRPP